MENETDVIRNQMLETRTSLSEKLEALEDKVLGTVQGTTETVTEAVQTVTEAVQDTVSNVSESVQDTVETVKSTFDLPQHVENHPWAMFGGAVAVGFLGGRLLPSVNTMASAATGAAAGITGVGASSPPFSSSPAGLSHLASTGSSHVGQESAPSGPGWLDNLSEAVAPVAKELEGMAISALAGVVGEMVLKSTPDNLRPHVTEWIEHFNKALGGNPIQGWSSGNGHSGSQR